jgi:uncharacterized membrane protein
MIGAIGKKRLSLIVSAFTHANARPELVFVVLALIAGLSMVIFNGPFQGFDEPNHFYRIYQLGQGQLLAKRIGDRAGGRLPEEIHATVVSFPPLTLRSKMKVDLNNLKTRLKTPPLRRKQIFVEFPNTAINTPVVYLPHVIGIVIGKVFGFSALALMYMGRILGLLCWITILWAAIRVAPAFKWTITLLALTPGPLFLAASLSADTVINVVSILLTAIVLRTAIGHTEIVGLGSRTVIATLCIFLSMAKVVYIPLVGLVMIIPASRFGGLKNKVVYCGAVTAVTAVTAILWGIETKNIYTTYDPFGYGIDAKAQVLVIMSAPWTYVCTIWNTIREQWWIWITMFVGVTSNGFVQLPFWIHKTYPLVLLGVAFLDNREANSLDSQRKVWIAILCSIVLLLVMTALYVTWNEPRAPVIQGIQGRYLIPVLLPALLLLYNRVFPFRKKLPLGAGVALYSAVVLGITCLKLYIRYYD